MSFEAKFHREPSLQWSAKAAEVGLSLYKPDYLSKLYQFKISDEQHRFTALPAEVMDISLRDAERYPVVMTADDEPVGFFVLHEGAGVNTYYSYTNKQREHVMLLRALLVDYAKQGYGYGGLAMQQLRSFIKYHFPHIREVVLAVHESNIPAQKLYLRSGFEDRGYRRQGAIGPQLILHYEV